jgi:N-methylhydantoinase A
MTDATLGVDVGGTFSDVVVWDGAGLATAKVPTTRDQSEGVVAGAAAAGASDISHFLHGTTVATNALLERSGATTALVTDDGFLDVIEIGRQDRPSLYDSFADRPEPLVPQERRHGRGGFDVGRDLRGVESVAISLLRAYDDPTAEMALRQAIAAELPGLPVSLSSEVAPEFREFERTSTTVLNAYLTPAVSGYLRRLVDRAGEAGLPLSVAVMRSSGGLIPVDAAAVLPVSVLLSGPAGGVVAAAAVGEALGRSHVVSFDMGGTSTDVCRIDNGVPEVAYQRSVEGFPCLMPSVAIHTVGAGGGSVAWIDDGGSLRVGPRSAGADPGPASYGKGGLAPTVTDANVVLRRIDPAARLGGDLKLDGEAALAAVARVGSRVGLGTAATSLGIVTVIEEVMAAAIRKVSVEQGVDPRRAALVAFGGAGGLHATSLARRLDMAAVIVPPHAGVFSALGLLLSPPRADASRTVILREPDGAELEHSLRSVGERALDALIAAVGGTATDVQHSVDVRYIGQSHEIAVPHEPGATWERLAARFHRLHDERNGFARPDDAIEAVTVRAVAVGEPVVRWADLPLDVGHGEPTRPSRSVVTAAGREVDAAVWWRPGLRPGDQIAGPAVVEEPEATTYLDEGEHATVAPGGALEVAW